MILRPCHAAPATGEVIPVWQAVEAAQRAAGDTFTMVTQPEHAVLAGDLAARFTAPPYPTSCEEVVRAIAWHDKGWAECDFRYTALNPPEKRATDRPRSFIAMKPAEFLTAWTRSIDACAGISATGGAMVSAHFSFLARYRLANVADSGEDTRTIREFLASESAREAALALKSGRSPEEMRALIELLQFCDLLSLYLCCGACAEVEFPQKFGGRTVRLRREGGAYVLTPSPFAGGADLGINAWKYPADPVPQPLAFLLR